MNYVSLLTAFLLITLTSGCGGGEDSKTITLFNSLSPAIQYSTSNDKQRIVAVEFNLNDIRGERKQEILKVLPSLSKLEYLRELTILGKTLRDGDLKLLPPMPKLEELTVNANIFTDEGLKYFRGMKNLKKLTLSHTQVRGPGLAYLISSSKLEWLKVIYTPLNDSAMPHIAANFKNLKRLGISSAKVNVTPNGLMQLVDLHWLLHIGVPDDIAGPDHIGTVSKEEKIKRTHEQHRAKRAFHLKYAKAYYSSKTKAAAAGEKVPPYWQYPFGSLPEMEELIRKEHPVTPPSKNVSPSDKGWTHYPAGQDYPGKPKTQNIQSPEEGWTNKPPLNGP